MEKTQVITIQENIKLHKKGLKNLRVILNLSHFRLGIARRWASEGMSNLDGRHEDVDRAQPYCTSLDVV